MKVLVIGKNGFVGKSLCEYFALKNKYSLTVVGSDSLDLLDESSVKSFLEQNYYDVILNCAVWNPSRVEEREKNRAVYYDMRMYHNIAKYHYLYGKMIYFGSGAEYDKRYPIVSVSENDFDRLIPVSDYGVAKYAINQHIEKSDNIYNLRIFGLYGKNEDYRVKFITGACAKAAVNLPISIRQNVYFDFLYIDDFCNMVERFIELENPMYHSYNIVSGRKIDLLSLANMVKAVAKEIEDKEIQVVVCKGGVGNEYTASNNRIINEIGNIQWTEHKKAINDLYYYFLERKESIDVMALLYQG